MTRVRTGRILAVVHSIGRRLTTLLLALGLVAGAWRPCAGWEQTAEARKSCCLRGSCAMHKGSHADGHPGGAALTQADADACCAMSERQDPQQPAAAPIVAIALVPLDALFAVAAPAPSIAPESWRPPPARGSRQPPRHLLLSVFLI